MNTGTTGKRPETNADQVAVVKDLGTAVEMIRRGDRARRELVVAVAELARAAERLEAIARMLEGGRDE